MTAVPHIHPGREPGTSLPLPPAPAFPVDLSQWAGHAELLRLAEASAARAGGTSWLNLVAEDAPQKPADDLLVLLAYCYLQGIYHSIDVVRRLETDAHLRDIRLRLSPSAEQVRRFRRDFRRSLTDCLTRAFVSLWQRRISPNPAGLASTDWTAPILPGGRPSFGFLEPFYLQAQDRIDRAVVFDSMALDE